MRTPRRHSPTSTGTSRTTKGRTRSSTSEDLPSAPLPLPLYPPCFSRIPVCYSDEANLRVLVALIHSYTYGPNPQSFFGQPLTVSHTNVTDFAYFKF